MAFFDNGDPEEFLLFIWNFKLALRTLVTLTDSANIHNLCMILHGKVLVQFDNLCSQIGSTNTAHLNWVNLGLGPYFFPVDVYSKQKPMMCSGIRKPCKLKLRWYAARLIDINEYLATFTGSKASANIGDTEFNEILLNSMTNVWVSKCLFRV